MTAAGTRLRGLLSLLLLLVLLVGIPVGLAVVGGSPLPSSLPSVEDVTTALDSPDDGQLFLGFLLFVGWLAWAFFALCVLVEVPAQLRGLPAPRLPGLGLGQAAARGLVAAVVALFLSAPAVANAAPTGSAGTGPSGAPAAVSQQIDGGSGVDPDRPQPAPAAAGPAGVSTQAPEAASHRVVAGESLWSIAEQELGDGTRWPEIAALNYGVVQADGRSLTDAHWLTPGWTLTLPTPPSPAPATPGAAGHPYTVQAGDTLTEIAAEQLGDADRYPEIAAASRDVEQPGGARLSDPDVIDVGWTLTIPSTPAAPAPAPPPTPAPPPAPPPAPVPAPAPTGKAPAPTTDDAADHSRGEGDERDGSADAELTAVDEAFPVRTIAGVGALLASGVLALLATRRGMQQHRRRPGQAIPLPTGPAAAVEQELRATADPLGVDTVDLALRFLARDCATTGRPLPAVRAARLTAEQFDLYLAEPAHLTEPWAGTIDATVWTLPAGATGTLDPALATEVPAPYPSLVTIGHDEEDGHVLLDLEHLGALSIRGDQTGTREVLAAIAVELATSRWADDLQVTIVGAYPELEDTLQTGRIRYLPAAGRLLDELTDRADRDRQALLAGAGDLGTARVSDTDADLWTPEIVLLTGEVTATQRAQLEQLTDQLPRVAIAAVTTGPPVRGGWGLQLDGQEAVLEPIGLRVRPQRLDDHTYLQLLEVLTLTHEDPQGRPDTAPEPTLQDLPAHDPDAHPHVVPVPADAADDAAPFDPTDGPPPPRVSRHQQTSRQPPTTTPTPGDTSGPDRPLATNGSTTVTTPRKNSAGPATGAAAADPAAARTPAGRPDIEQDGATAPQTSGDHPDDVVPTPAPRIPERHDATGGEAGFPDDDEPADTGQDRPAATAPRLLPTGPRVLLLGPVDVEGAEGPVEPSKRASLTELAAYLALNPGGDHEAIDAAIWPGKRVSPSARNTAVSKLRRWLGKDADGEDHLPRYQATAGYRLADSVTTDWHTWRQLLPDGPLHAPTASLQAALQLVRGTPVGGVKARRYTWAEQVRQEMIAAVVDTAYELARRRLMDGRWREATHAAVLGLSVEPGLERLARIRILAAHCAGNQAEEEKAIAQLLAVAEDLGGDLEPQTEKLLADLRDPQRADRLPANAL